PARDRGCLPRYVRLPNPADDERYARAGTPTSLPPTRPARARAPTLSHRAGGPTKSSHRVAVRGCAGAGAGGHPPLRRTPNLASNQRPGARRDAGRQCPDPRAVESESPQRDPAPSHLRSTTARSPLRPAAAPHEGAGRATVRQPVCAMPLILRPCVNLEPI